ncbi:MAG: hypothetical protein JO307_30235 [Bryobacterales bacterium]|nr:hypothetical protein [Bryobacterales bacterium]MBV9400416.1 hypothetical protein [Bryobacterales bacterium]
MKWILFFAALGCFASFGWGMLRHFRRDGKPSPGMILTAAAAPLFAAMHVFALLEKPLMCPLLAGSIYLAGAALFWRAVAATRGHDLAACFQHHAPAAVVRGGPYRFVRHPFYCAYTLVWIGGWAATGWLPLAFAAIFMASLYICATLREEREFLGSPRRDAYLSYMQTTGRFFPKCRGLISHHADPID